MTACAAHDLREFLSRWPAPSSGPSAPDDRSRLARLDELLASEEVPEGLVARLPLPSHDLGDGWTRVNVAVAALRWFREQLAPQEGRGRWRHETCQRCHRRNPVGFQVDDESWSAIVRGRWDKVCLSCFDEEAEAAGQRYSLLGTWTVAYWDEPSLTPPAEPQASTDALVPGICAVCGRTMVYDPGSAGEPPAWCCEECGTAEPVAAAEPQEAGAAPDPGASPDPRDWPGGIPTDPRAYFSAHPLSEEEIAQVKGLTDTEGEL